MQIDNAGLPSEIVERVEEAQGRLSKGRRKRAVPAAWATRADVATYEVVAKAEVGDAAFVDVDASGAQALVGGSDGAAVVDVQTGTVSETLAKGESVSAGAWAGEKAVLLVKAGNGGVVKVFEGAKEVGAIAAHAGPVNGVAVHPTGDVVASIGKDKSFVVYDLESMKAVAQVYTENGKPLLTPRIQKTKVMLIPHRTHSLRLPPRRPPPSRRPPRHPQHVPHHHPHLRRLLPPPIPRPHLRHRL